MSSPGKQCQRSHQWILEVSPWSHDKAMVTRNQPFFHYWRSNADPRAIPQHNDSITLQIHNPTVCHGVAALPALPPHTRMPTCNRTKAPGETLPQWHLLLYANSEQLVLQAGEGRCLQHTPGKCITAHPGCPSHCAQSPTGQLQRANTSKLQVAQGCMQTVVCTQAH